MRREVEKHSQDEAKLLLEKWKIDVEDLIRQDALKRSGSINLGKAAELLTPFHQYFISKFNPRDARFMGNPIDFIVFDGYTEEKENIMLYFVEVKTGNSKLTAMQKRIRQAVEAKRVKWEPISYDELSFMGKKEISTNNANLSSNFEDEPQNLIEKGTTLQNPINIPVNQNLLGLLAAKIYLKANMEVVRRTSVLMKSGKNFNEAFDTSIAELSLSFPDEKAKLKFKKRILKNM